MSPLRSCDRYGALRRGILGYVSSAGARRVLLTCGPRGCHEEPSGFFEIRQAEELRIWYIDQFSEVIRWWRTDRAVSRSYGYYDPAPRYDDGARLDEIDSALVEFCDASEVRLPRLSDRGNLL